MSNIDNRIVILSFDNKDFESNVQTSLGTLDKLKKGLNLEESAKGLSAISASARSFSLDGITGAIENAKYRFSTLGIAGATVISELTKTAMGLGGKLISAISGSLTQGGWKRALNIEQAKFQLEGLKVAWKDIEADINYGVKDTAYGLDAAAKAASQLTASGIQLGEEMQYSLRGISGVAAMTSSSYEDISNVFTQVAGQGRVMATDLNSLAARGLNAAATLADALGITEREVRELVSKGEIDFRTFAKAMDDAFGAHAKDANKTFTGAMSNVKAALSRIGADVAASALMNLRDIFNALIPLINNVHTALKPLIERFNAISTSATEGFVGFLNKLNRNMPEAKKNIAEVSGVIKELKDSGFKDFDKLYESMGKTEEEFNKMAENGELSTKKLIGYMDAAFGDKAPSILDKFREKAEEATGKLDETAETAVKASEEIDEAAQRVLSGEFGNGDERRQQLEALGYSYEEVQNKVNELLGCEFRYETETKDAADVTHELGTEAERAEKALSKQKDATEKATDTASNFKGALSLVTESLKRAGGAVKDSFVSVFTGTFSGFVEKFSAVIRELAEHWYMNEDAARGLKVVLTGFFNVIKGGIRVLGLIGQGAAKLLGLIGEGVMGLLELIGKFDTAFEESGRKAALMEALGTVIDKVKEIIIAFKDKLVEVGTAIKNSEGFQRLQEVLERLWEIIKEFAGSIFDSVVAKMKEFGDYDPNFSWLDKFVDLVSRAAGGLADFIEALINGENPIKGFFDGMGEGEGPLSKVVGFLGKVKDAVVDFFKNFKIGDVGGGLGSFKDKLVEGFENFKDSGFFDTVIDIFKKLGEKLKEVPWEDIKKAVLEMVAIILAIKYVKSLIDMNNAVTDTLGSVQDVLKGFTLDEAFKRDWSQKIQSFAIGVGILAAALFAISKIPAEDLKRSVITLGGIMGALVGVYAAIEAMPFSGESMQRFSTSVAALGAGLVLLSVALKILGAMDPGEFRKAASELLQVILMLAVGARIAGQSSFGTLVGMALAVDLIVPALLLLGKAKWSTIKKGVQTIGEVIMILAIGARIAGRSSFGTLVGMALAVDLLVPALIILGKMDWSTIQQGVAAIAEITLTLSIAARIAGQSSFGTMIGMAATVAAVVVALKVMETMEFDSLVTSAAALSGTLIAIAAALKIADGIKGAGGVAALIVVIAGLTVAFKLLADIPMENTIAIAASLSGTALALAGALTIVSLIDFKRAMGSVIAMAAVLASLVIAFKVMATIPTEQTLAIAKSLSLTAIALSAALLLLVPVGAYSSAALVGIGVFDLFIADLVGVLAALGKLTEVEGFSELISEGAGVFGQIGKGLGNFIGGILGGIGEGITDVLPTIADNLSSFAEKMEPFFTAIGSVSGDILTSTKNLAEAVLLICGASMLDSLASFLNFGEDPFVKVGRGLATFAPYLKTYADNVKDIDPEAVESSARAALLLAEFARRIPNEGGKLAEYLGDNTLSQFAAHLVPFGQNITYYSKIVSGNVDERAIESSVNAGKLLTGLANEIPNEGGKLAEWLGDNTLSMFAEHLIPFGLKIVQYSKIVSGNVDDKAIKASANAAMALATLANELPNEGGVLAYWLGDNTLSTFANHLIPFGINITSYSRIVDGNINESAIEASTRSATLLANLETALPNSGGVLAEWIGDNTLANFAQELIPFANAITQYSKLVDGNVSTTAVAASASAGTMVAEFYAKTKDLIGGAISQYFDGSPLSSLAKELMAFGAPIAIYSNLVSNVDPDAVEASTTAGEMLANFYSATKDLIGGGWKQLVDGSPLTALGKELESFAPYLVRFSEKASELKSEDIDKVTRIIPSLSYMLSSLSSTDTDGVKGYGESLSGFGEELKKYSASVDSVKTEKISDVCRSVYELINVALSMATVSTESMDSFGNALKNIGEKGIEEFLAGFEEAEPQAREAGEGLLRAALEGAEDAASYNNWYYIGSNSTYGLINGLSSLYWSVYNEGYSIGSAAVAGARAALDVASPSKEMFKVGEFTGQGLINGLIKMGSRVAQSGERLGETVMESVVDPLSKIADLITADMDLNPVITPVLDLGTFEKDASRISALMGGRSISVTSRVNALAAASGLSYRQSGNNEVVDAINKLKKNIGNFNTFNITVDGTENPETFADALIRRIKNKSRV